jgi:hypothetical protein
MSADEVVKLESVQHKAIYMVEELKGYSYYERLRILGITDLESRRKRGDIIQIYKLVNGLEEVNIGLRRPFSRPAFKKRKFDEKQYFYELFAISL